MNNYSMKNIFAFYQTYIEISDLFHLLVSFTSVVMQYLSLLIAVWNIVLVTVKVSSTNMYLGTKIQDARPGERRNNLENN